MPTSNEKFLSSKLFVFRLLRVYQLYTCVMNQEYVYIYIYIYIYIHILGSLHKYIIDKLIYIYIHILGSLHKYIIDKLLEV